MSCIFCEIAKKNIPSNIIYEDDLVMAIMDIKPVCDGHIMVIPKKHIETVFEAEAYMLNHMFDVASILTPIIMEALTEDGMTISINYGSQQEIKHLHMHLLPNFKKKSTSTIEDVYKKIMDKKYEKKIEEKI